MEYIELRKYLYKTTRYAQLDYIRKGVAYYSIDVDSYETGNGTAHFHVPIEEMGDATFSAEEKPSLLWRWFAKI